MPLSLGHINFSLFYPVKLPRLSLSLCFLVHVIYRSGSGSLLEILLTPLQQKMVSSSPQMSHFHRKVLILNKSAKLSAYFGLGNGKDSI